MPCAGGAAFAKVTRKWFRRAHGFRVGTRPSDRNHKRNSVSVAAQDGCQRFQSRHLVGRDADSGASRHANFLVRRSLAHDRTAEARTYAGAIKPYVGSLAVTFCIISLYPATRWILQLGEDFGNRRR